MIRAYSCRSIVTTTKESAMRAVIFAGRASRFLWVNGRTARATQLRSHSERTITFDGGRRGCPDFSGVGGHALAR
jgi:hypothetical protein